MDDPPENDPVLRLSETMLQDVKDHVPALLSACARRDVKAVNRIANDLTGRHGRDGTFATCSALAIFVARRLGLDELAEELPPSAGAVVGFRLPRVVLYGETGFQARFDAARLFVSLLVSMRDRTNYDAIAADDRNQILRGLCEQVAAVGEDSACQP